MEENSPSNLSLPCKTGKKERKNSFPLTERIRRNSFEICSLQMQESGKFFLSLGKAQYMIKNLLVINTGYLVKDR